MKSGDQFTHPAHGIVTFVREDEGKSVVKLANGVETTVTTECLVAVKAD